MQTHADDSHVREFMKQTLERFNEQQRMITVMHEHIMALNAAVDELLKDKEDGLNSPKPEE